MTLNIKNLLGIAVLLSVRKYVPHTLLRKDGSLRVKIMPILFSLTIMTSSGNR